MKEFILAILLTTISFMFGKEAGIKSEQRKCQSKIDVVQKLMMNKCENLIAGCE